jgi:hypothetical protein
MKDNSAGVQHDTAANAARTSNQAGIVARIRSLTSSMSPAESRISQLVLHDPAAVSRMTISELSDDVFGTLAGDADCQVGTVLAPRESCVARVLLK